MDFDFERYKKEKATIHLRIQKREDFVPALERRCLKVAKKGEIGRGGFAQSPPLIGFIYLIMGKGELLPMGPTEQKGFTFFFSFEVSKMKHKILRFPFWTTSRLPL